MVDRPQPALPAWVPFDKKAPIVGIDPDDETDLTWVCFNSAWLPHILGALGVLARVEIWNTDDLAVRNLEAMRGEHLLHLFMEGCACPEGENMFAIRACQEGCGIEWSDDGGQSWQCIELTTCISEVSTGVLTDWLSTHPYQGPVTPPDDFSQPQPGGCKTFHVTMAPFDVWKLPALLSSGDTIEVTNLTGAWSDGFLHQGLWYDWDCPTGRAYYLGQCTAYHYAESSDPNQSAYHMELMLQVENSNLLVSRGIQTVPGGILDLEAVFVPNYDRAQVGFGAVQFDVEWCKAEVSYDWYHTYNLDVEQGGWDLMRGQWTEGVGVEATYNNGSNNLELKFDLYRSGHITFVKLVGNYQMGAYNPYNAIDMGGAHYSQVIVAQLPSGLTFNFSKSYSVAVDIDTPLYLAMLAHYGGAGGLAVLKTIVVAGTGPDPFVE